MFPKYGTYLIVFPEQIIGMDSHGRKTSSSCLSRAQPMRNCHNSANKMSLYFKIPIPSTNSLLTIGFPIDFLLFKRVLLSLLRGTCMLQTLNSNSLLVLNKLIFAGEITGSQCVLERQLLCFVFKYFYLKHFKGLLMS